jgi:hypothetical protein
MPNTTQGSLLSPPDRQRQARNGVLVPWRYWLKDRHQAFSLPVCGATIILIPVDFARPSRAMHCLGYLCFSLQGARVPQ